MTEKRKPRTLDSQEVLIAVERVSPAIEEVGMKVSWQRERAPRLVELVRQCIRSMPVLSSVYPADSEH